MNMNELDYQLYKLLEENNFETSKENLEIIKECLSDDSIEILDVSNITFNENCEIDDSVYKKILENNGLESDEEDIQELKEDIDAGEVLLTEGVFRKWRNKRRARKRMKQMWKEGKAGPQLKHTDEESTKEEATNEPKSN